MYLSNIRDKEKRSHVSPLSICLLCQCVSSCISGPSAAAIPLLWERAAALQCDVWDVKADPRGEDFDDENSRIAELASCKKCLLHFSVSLPVSYSSLSLCLRRSRLVSTPLSPAFSVCLLKEDSAVASPLRLLLSPFINPKPLSLLLCPVDVSLSVSLGR